MMMKSKSKSIDGNAWNKNASQGNPAGKISKGFPTKGYKLKAQGNPFTTSTLGKGKLDPSAQGNPETQKNF